MLDDQSAGVGRLVGQTVGVDRHVCLSIKQMG